MPSSDHEQARIPGVKAPRRSADAVFRELQPGQGGVLLHLASGGYHGVNEVGAAIWGLIDGSRDASTIASELGRRLDDPPDDLRADVETFLRSLRERALIDG